MYVGLSVFNFQNSTDGNAQLIPALFSVLNLIHEFVIHSGALILVEYFYGLDTMLLDKQLYNEFLPAKV